MSGSAAIASAQRRRAGGQAANNQHEKFAKYKASNQSVDVRENSPAPAIMHVKDILSILSGRIDDLKRTSDAHSAHWKEHDAFLKEVCDKVDSLEDRISKLEGGRSEE